VGIVVVGAYIEGARLRDPRRGPAPMTCRALPGLPTRPAGLSVRPAMKIRFPLLALNIAGGAAVLASYAYAFGSLSILAHTVRHGRAATGPFRWLPFLGALAFSFHTVVLDALVWPALYPL
jgi:hypothetical protein